MNSVTRTRTAPVTRWCAQAISGLVPAIIIAAAAAFFWAGCSEAVQWGAPAAAECNYNLLVQGFCDGQLNLKRPLPPELARLANPYDPNSNQWLRDKYGIHDLSFYRGKLYLYFGVTPAVLVFWPWHLLTDDFLSEQCAVALLSIAGVLVCARLVFAIRRRYFPEVGTVPLAVGVATIAFGTGLPLLLQRASMWETPVACAFALSMITLGALWRAIHRPEQRSRWVALASLGSGLTVGARPSLLFGCAILLIPIAGEFVRHGESRRARVCAAACLPLAAVLLCLMAYNQARFDNPFEFGPRYQLTGDYRLGATHFSVRFVWANLRTYLFGAPRWIRQYPFVGPVSNHFRPSDQADPDDTFAILSSVPIVWFALAAPLGSVGRHAAEGRRLGWFLLATGGLSLGSFIPLSFFYGSVDRYEVDFLPEIVLLAAIGILTLERRLRARPGGRWAARAIWGSFAAVSVAFNLCAAIDKFGLLRAQMGQISFRAGRLQAAQNQFELAVMAKPSVARLRDSLGVVYLQENDPEKALEQFEAAERIDPNSSVIHRDFALALALDRRWTEAADQWKAALALDPGNPQISHSLGETSRQIELMKHPHGAVSDKFIAIFRAGP